MRFIVLWFVCVLPFIQTLSLTRKSRSFQEKLYIGSEILFADVVFPGSTVCNSSDCQSSGKTLKASLNTSVDPCDDFYEFACGGWMSSHTIPDDGVFYFGDVAIEEAIYDKIREGLTEKRSSSDSKTIVFAADLYKSCLDEASRKTVGVKPLVDMLESIGGWPLAAESFDEKTYDWAEVLATLVADIGVDGIFSLGLGPDANNTKVQRFSFDPAGLGLGSNQLLQQDDYPDIVKAYKKYILETAMLLGGKNDSQTLKAIDEIVEFEAKLANQTANEDESDDLSDSYNLLSIKEFSESTGNSVDWLKFMNNIYKKLNSTLRLTSDELVIVSDLDYYTDVPKLVASTPKRVIANYFGWIVANSFGIYTVDAFRTAAFEFNRVLTGATKQKELSKSCLNIVSSFLEYGTSRLFLDKGFSKDDKKQASIIVNDVKEAFDDLLTESDWLDAETKARAITKLDAIHQNVGYPDWILNNTALDEFYNLTKPADVKNFLANIRYIIHQANELDFNGIRDPVNLNTNWPMPPQLVNAAYDPTQNSITIPAAQLLPPYFDIKSPAAINYGAIGAVVGHELTHGFDDEGSQFDENGNLRNWWTDEIHEKFSEKAECFINEYNSYVDPQTKLHLNGNNTIGENIADNGGVREAFRAYQKNIQKAGKQERLPTIDSYTAEQQFFISYANSWCTKYRTEYLSNMIQYNEHSPAKYRVNVPLANFAIFSQAFKCSDNSNMNRKNKCVLW